MGQRVMGVVDLSPLPLLHPHRTRLKGNLLLLLLPHRVPVGAWRIEVRLRPLL